MRAALFRPTSRVSMSAFLTPDSISAQTSEHQVLFSDLTLSVGAERVGLVGRNGSGKSTLIRIIAGMAEPAAGAVQRMGAIAVYAVAPILSCRPRDGRVAPKPAINQSTPPLQNRSRAHFARPGDLSDSRK
jgi:ABC-type phosphate/phosphonate transport system ATPase subunit